MGKALFYPGCSLESGGGYLESINAVSKSLGLELEELHDWNCCGSTMLKAYDSGKAAILAARNFSLAKKAGADTLVAICNACLSMLTEQRNILRENDALRAKAEKALAAAGHELFLDIEIVHLLDLIMDKVGLDKIRSLVKKPLGAKIGAYYGCLYTRPARKGIDRDDPEYLEQLIEAIGGTSVRFAPKMYCCGTSQPVTHPESGKLMPLDILAYGARRETDALITICPMCNFNLEAASGTESLPYPTGVMFFTQAMGIAFGMTEEELGLEKLLLPPKYAAEAANQ